MFWTIFSKIAPALLSGKGAGGNLLSAGLNLLNSAKTIDKNKGA